MLICGKRGADLGFSSRQCARGVWQVNNAIQLSLKKSSGGMVDICADWGCCGGGDGGLGWYISTQ